MNTGTEKKWRGALGTELQARHGAKSQILLPMKTLPSSGDV